MTMKRIKVSFEEKEHSILVKRARYLKISLFQLIRNIVSQTLENEMHGGSELLELILDHLCCEVKPSPLKEMYMAIEWIQNRLDDMADSCDQELSNDELLIRFEECLFRIISNGEISESSSRRRIESTAECRAQNGKDEKMAKTMFHEAMEKIKYYNK